MVTVSQTLQTTVLMNQTKTKETPIMTVMAMFVMLIMTIVALLEDQILLFLKYPCKQLPVMPITIQTLTLKVMAALEDLTMVL